MKLFGGEKSGDGGENHDPFGYDKVFSVPEDLQSVLDSGEELAEKNIEKMYNQIVEMGDAVNDVAMGITRHEQPFEGYTMAYNRDYLDKMQTKKRALEVEYTAALLPEQNKDAFIEWANQPESLFDFDLIVKGIFAHKLGAPEEMIKESIVMVDRGLGEEGNQKMGEVAYDKMLEFLGGEKVDN